jgi:hypothetical protein
MNVAEEVRGAADEIDGVAAELHYLRREVQWEADQGRGSPWHAELENYLAEMIEGVDRCHERVAGLAFEISSSATRRTRTRARAGTKDESGNVVPFRPPPDPWRDLRGVFTAIEAYAGACVCSPVAIATGVLMAVMERAPERAAAIEEAAGIFDDLGLQLIEIEEAPAEDEDADEGGEAA